MEEVQKLQAELKTTKDLLQMVLIDAIPMPATPQMKKKNPVYADGWEAAREDAAMRIRDCMERWKLGG